jgi:hypothetical protein
MARRKRSNPLFNLSFLDIMSCGFGAVVLVFLITRHSIDVHAEEVNENLLAEVDLIEEEVTEGRLDLVRLREAISQMEARVAESDARSAELREETETRRVDLARLKEETSAREETVAELRSDIENLEDQAEQVEGRRFGSDDEGRAARAFVGEGNRQYLTGLRVGGDRVLILVDVSASMLDETIVNILRRRNMAPERQRAAEKWQRTLGTMDWLTAQLPLASRFQIYTFSETWSAAVEGTEGRWLDVTGGELGDAAEAVRARMPSGGTALAPVLEAVGDLSPLPDNIYVITDGLPTRDGREPRRGTVTGRERERLFAEAARGLPPGIPVNVILLHLEGDPMAASLYWKLAVNSGGSFMSPSRDWP